MFSLITTVQSISLLADLHQNRFEQYKKEAEPSLKYEESYKIPSLIWPPPKSTRQEQTAPYLYPPPSLLFLWKEKGDSSWRQQ